MSRPIAGPHDPVDEWPARAAGSLRRTSTIDSFRPDGPDGRIVFEAQARDLLTATDGIGRVVHHQRFRAEVGPFGQGIELLTADPGEPRLAELVGAVVGPGFRAKVSNALPDLVASGSLLYLLLDDWAGASLVAGYATQRALTDSGREGTRLPESMVVLMADVCAGWSDDASMMDFIRGEGTVPTPLGPPAPPLASPGDPLAVHGLLDLAPHSMRRFRRLDVGLSEPDGPAGAAWFSAHFRDSHVDGEGQETVVHEYTVTGTVDGARRVAAVDARARVLPWQECPGSLASASRVVGMQLGDLRPRVRNELIGASTCTHLNDTLRSVADAGYLLSELEQGSTRS